LTDYRDCIIHNAPIDFGLGTGSMQKLDGGVWSVLMRIPDNPEVAGQQLLAVGRLSGVQRLEVGAEDRLEAAPPLRVVGRLLGDRRLIGHRHVSLPPLRIAQVPSMAGRA
jgi:hypothetical protein